MDKAALIGRAAFLATLKRTRLKSIEAKVFAKMPVGGQVRSVTTVALTENSEGEWISTVGLKLDGFPKDVDREAVRSIEPMFTIEVVAQGAYAWSNKDRPNNDLLMDSELARMLGRTVYLAAAGEVQRAAQKLGLGGIKVTPDIPSPADEDAVLLTPEDKKTAIERLLASENAPPKEQTAKKQTAKKRTKKPVVKS